MFARVTAPPEEMRVLRAAADDLVPGPQALVGVVRDLDEIPCLRTFGAVEKTQG
jgi:hypothetical protein